MYKVYENQKSEMVLALTLFKQKKYNSIIIRIGRGQEIS